MRVPGSKDAAKVPLRSRKGCQRCKGRRQKCDEKRPSCGRCLSAGIGCSYELNIRWGGREFTQSRFGKCEVHKIENGSGNFVYSIQDPSMSPSGGHDGTEVTKPKDQPQMTSPPRPLSRLPGIVPEQQLLVDYFVRQGSSAISPHQRLQQDTCRVLIPLALDAAPLLHAIGAFSAAQWASYTVDNDMKASLFRREAQSRAMCVRALREEIMSPKGTRSTVVMASSLILCFSALYYQTDDYNSWRVYFRGVKAALPAACSPRNRSVVDASLDEFLRMRYLILETITTLSGGFEPSDHVLDSTEIDEQLPTFYDDHVESRSNLFLLLRDISSVGQERRRKQRVFNQDGRSLRLEFQSKADRLESDMLQMIGRHRDTPPSFLLSDKEQLDAEQVKEFTLCHQIYEYTGLLHIRTQIRGYQPNDPRVQEAVKKIISLTKQVNLRPGLSPSLGLNTALFPAGQYALPEDRPAIKALLVGIHEATHNRNCMVAVENLEMHWQGKGANQQSMDGVDFISF